MKFILAAAFRTSFNGYAEASNAELVVKLGNQFDKVLAEVVSSIPNGYVLDFTVQVFVDNILNPSLSPMVEGALQKVIDVRHEEIKTAESSEPS